MLYHFSQRKAFVTPSWVIIRYSPKVNTNVNPAHHFFLIQNMCGYNLLLLYKLIFGGSGEGGGVERNGEEEKLGKQIYAALDVVLTEAQKQNE